MMIQITAKSCLTGLCAVVLLLTANLAWAEAGRVLYVSGEASLVRGDAKPLSKGDAVETGDVLITGANGRIQLLMADGDRIALRPNSEFRIDKFSGPARVSPGQAVDARPSSWKSFYSLVRGGIRTLTHSLGERGMDSYQVRTPVATIGIRGTDFTAVCVGGCGAGGASGEGDGLYTGVSGGTIFLQNGSGEWDVGDGMFAFVGGDDAIPDFFSEQPGVLNDSTEGGEGDWNEQVEGEGEGEESEFSSRSSPTSGSNDPNNTPNSGGGTQTPGDNQPPAQSYTGTGSNGEPFNLNGGQTQQPPRGIAVATGPLKLIPDGDGGFLYQRETIADAGYVPNSTLRVDANGNLTSFVGNLAAQGDPDQFAGFTIAGVTGAASNVNTGRDLEFGTGLRWGRWAGGKVQVRHADGSTEDVGLLGRSVHWMYGPGSASPPAIPITGYASYALIGNTDPTDNHGNVGVLGSAYFEADFDNQLVYTGVDVSVNGRTWNGNGHADISNGTFANKFDSVSVTDGEGCSNGCAGDGEFAGFFTPGGSASAPPPGAGMTYSMSDQPSEGNTTVSGSAAFGNPNSSPQSPN